MPLLVSPAFVVLLSSIHTHQCRIRVRSVGVSVDYSHVSVANHCSFSICVGRYARAPILSTDLVFSI
jgi:hypothetical protein